MALHADCKGKLQPCEVFKLTRPKLGYLVVKRLIDVVLSFIGLIIAAPVLIFFCILIRLESKGPCIYGQKRLGKNGKLFTIYKLRSMDIDADRDGQRWTHRNDPRVTKVGRFIRRTHIDELPQLFNVLKNDMSLVGPRPERPHFAYKFTEILPHFADRLLVKPGLTGWAQINGGYDIPIKEKLEKDLYYIRNQSLLLDIKILFKTLVIVVTLNGAR